MTLRDTSGDKMKGLEYPSYPLLLSLEANDYLFFPEVNFYLLRESFPDIPDEVIHNPNKCPWN